MEPGKVHELFLCRVRMIDDQDECIVPFCTETVQAGMPHGEIRDTNDCLSLRDVLGITDQDFCIYARGNSMVDAGIHSGDMLIVQAVPSWDNGDIVVVQINGQATVKKIYRDNNHIMLHPCNPNFPDLILDESDEVEIIGKLKSTIKTYM